MFKCNGNKAKYGQVDGQVIKTIAISYNNNHNYNYNDNNNNKDLLQYIADRLS